MSVGAWVFLAVVALLVVVMITTYNRLVGLNQRSQEAWSDVDVQLKRRADLVRNLVVRASESFQQLQGQISEVEDTIQNARRYHEAVVRDLNTLTESFPSNFVAGTFHFVKRGFFELERPEDRQVPRVSFGG